MNNNNNNNMTFSGLPPIPMDLMDTLEPEPMPVPSFDHSAVPPEGEPSTSVAMTTTPTTLDESSPILVTTGAAANSRSALPTNTNHDNVVTRAVAERAILPQMNVEHNWMNGIYTKITLKNTPIAANATRTTVYSLYYDANNIVCAMRDFTIRLWYKRSTSASTARRSLIGDWSQPSMRDSQTLVGHTGSVYSLQCNERYIVSASNDRSIRLWRRADGTCLCVKSNAHTDQILSLKLVDHTLVSGSSDRSVKVWQVNASFTDMECLAGNGSQHASAVNSVDFNGRLLVSGSADNAIKVWSWDGAHGVLMFVRNLLGHTNSVSCVCLQWPYVASGGGDCTVRVWHAESGQCLRILSEHHAELRCISMSVNYVVSGDTQGTIIVWDKNAAVDLNLHHIPCKRQIYHNPHESVICLRFDENEQIVWGSHNGTIKIMDFTAIGNSSNSSSRRY